MIETLLAHFGTDRSSFLGAGAEAQVFALGPDKALRVHAADTVAADVAARVALLSRLQNAPQMVRFEIPHIRDFGFQHGFHFTIEDRLTGRPMHQALPQCTPTQRERLVNDYLESATQVTGLLKNETEYGELALANPIRSISFKDFLRARAEASLNVCGLNIDVDDLIAKIDEPDKPSLVHLDYCPSNVLCENGKITAVLDFGGTTIAGCASFNPIAAAAFLNPSITPAANDAGQQQANAWLDDHGFTNKRTPITKWLAAYWSFCGKNDDLPLFHCCRDILGSPKES
ncbi:phosphotransferase family enzyme [Yoonia maritima]|uniref:Phosphotransferase family enzyme n=1 Tax=Yoonia maritima TaxID=1435347 RepID=A0A2T0W4Q2_9RHOB|nr:phosphotransferase [Yoonia maritima]PRY80449.1 phosphotransferase family enzyme [Yoonia maritima]